jgi:CBS domain-containing protein
MSTICPSCATRNLEGVDECANCGADLRTVDLPKPATRMEQNIMQLPLTALHLTSVHAIAAGTLLEDALHALDRQNLDILEVVEEGRLIGVLSVRDVMMRIGPDYPAKMGRPVREFMTASPESLPPDAPITFAINKMDVGGYRHVPVVQPHDGHAIGVVSVRDVIRHIVKNSKMAVVTVGKTTSHGVSDSASATV